MNIPYWIKKRISSSETIECVATGRLTGTSDGKFFNAGHTALVGTSTGFYVLTKGFILNGHTGVINWEELSDEIDFLVKGSIFGSEIFMKINGNRFSLRTSRREAEAFVLYVSSKRSDKHRYAKQEYITSSGDIVKP
ncbi:MAG: hypothetical protein ACTSXT_03880 [Candidatus Helarchaeota archaeon]